MKIFCQDEENERKRAQELDRQQVATKMEELQTAKTLLEQQMSVHKKRLQMETQATRQVHSFIHTFIYLNFLSFWAKEH